LKKIPEINSAKSIPTRRLKNVWKRISDKPLPDVYAFILEDKEFLSTLNLLRKQSGVEDTIVKEYGVDFPNKFIEACTFEFRGHWIVLVKQSVSLNDSLEHELRHIHSGDVALP
jgi:hypothetical protein